jgi:hypothetical protein
LPWSAIVNCTRSCHSSFQIGGSPVIIMNEPSWTLT